MGELTTRDTVEVAVAPRHGDTPGDDVATSALATVREVTGEIVRLVRTAATQATDAWSLVPLVRSLLPDLERVVEERTVLGRDARALRAQVGDLRERIHELEALIAAREAGWKAERVAFEDDVARERERAEMLGQDLEHRRAEISLLEGRARRLREQTDSAAARADADREKTLRLAREMVQSAEEARIAVVGELETLRATLAAEQARLDETQHERARATQGVVELEADLAHARQIIEQVEASRAGTAAELSRARATLVHTDDELLAVQHEHQLSQAHLEKLCAAHDDMVEEQAQLVAKLHDANEREARLRLCITGLEQRIQAGRDGTPVVIDPPAKAIDAVVQAATAGLTTELARAEDRLQVLRDELTQTKAAASAATVRVETLAAEVHTRERARAAAVAELESLRATVAAFTPNESVTPEPEQVPVSVVPEPTVDEPIAEPSVDVAPPTAETETAGEHSTPARAPIAILDTFDVWAGTGVADVHRIGPGPEALDQLRELAPACCVVNLGAPGALEAAAALRCAGMTVPLWGFAMAPNGTALALGRFEVIARPIDPERVRAQLTSLAPSDGNAIMVGSDSATQMPIREGLLQLGLSVRTAWNREQAAELAGAVEPDLVTIDLGTAAAGAAELIVDLLRCEKAATIVFVPGAPEYVEVLAAAVGAHGVPIDRAAIVGAAAAKR